MEEAVGFDDAGDALEPYRLDQSVLQRAVGTLDPALGLGRVGADDLDIEHVQGTAEMRHAVAVGRGAVVAEYAVLVRIEGNRLAVPLQICAGGLHVGEGGLALCHLEVHQLAGGVVDIDQQAAARAAALEPVMVRAIDLDELAAALAPIAGLVEPGALGGLGFPKTGTDHQLAQGLVRERDAMALGQIFGRQRRPEIGIALADDAEVLLAVGFAQPAVARPTALPGYQASGAVSAEPVQQPIDLAPA